MTARPHLPPRSRQWSDLITTDFASIDLARAIAVLPLGATEQHGPHLPLSVDANLAHSMVHVATTHLPPDLPALFLPVQRIGHSPEHAGFAGTLSLKAETVMRLWTDIAESVSASGVNKLVLFNTHGGNVGLMDVVARELRTRMGMLVYSVSWFNLPLKNASGEDLMARFSADEQRFGVHGGQIETAMMLALKPRLVRQSKAQDFKSASQQRAADFAILGDGKSAKLAWAAQDLNTEGAAGNAAAAKVDDGLALVDAAGRALAALLVEIDRLPPHTLRRR
ncbi:creatininase family protein [Ottowia testudinis]|uniref:Creatininase family protein n=1 Tax=Ottowia testudinis TaxID=2816950 RepID=A0A975CGZ1_9BURK|nr:creatininase family protein [Ottowia testudinis]QTD44906.1 creatininase family protein [Ottowia testudinis]